MKNEDCQGDEEITDLHARPCLFALWRERHLDFFFTGMLVEGKLEEDLPQIIPREIRENLSMAVFSKTT
jgi:hypothetical protein